MAVVIPTCGRPASVTEIVEAVLDDAATSEVIVVSDGPGGPTREALARFVDPRLRLLEIDRPGNIDHRGHLGRDRGVRAAASDIVLMLDDDVVPRPGLVSGHGAWHLTANDLVVLGYMPVAAGAGAPSRLYARFYGRACHEFETGSEAVLRGLWAGNLSVRRIHWLRATEAPWNDPGYHGDQELGLRLLQLGLRGVFDRTLEAEHRYARTLDGMIRDAEDAAASSVRLRRAYGDLVPAAQPQPPQVAAVTRLLVWLVGPRRSWSVSFALLRAAARASGSAGMVRLEDRFVSLLYRLAYERALAGGSKR